MDRRDVIIRGLSGTAILASAGVAYLLQPKANSPKPDVYDESANADFIRQQQGPINSCACGRPAAYAVSRFGYITRWECAVCSGRLPDAKLDES